MAKPRRAKDRYTGKGRRAMVSAIADVLKTGEPTVFRFEALCRHTLRSGNVHCAARSWGLADAISADIVHAALEQIGAKRPPWLWGQREYVEKDCAATRIGFSHCLNCGTRLPEGRSKFCGKTCGNRFRNAVGNSEETIVANRVRALASREAYRQNAASIRCETCERPFKPSGPAQRFCSRQCSGERSVTQKMNGRKHPWKMNGTTIGGHGANGVTHSYPPQRLNGNGSAIVNASAAIATPSSHANAPKSAPNSSASNAASPSRAPGAPIANIARYDANGAALTAPSNAPRSAPT